MYIWTAYFMDMDESTSILDDEASLDNMTSIFINVTSSLALIENMTSSASSPRMTSAPQLQDTTVTQEASASAMTTMCSNVYCVSEDDYLDMIVDYVTPTLLECFLIVAYFLVFLVGLVGNFLVCFAVWRNHSMRTVTNYFIGKCIKLYQSRCTCTYMYMYSACMYMYVTSFSIARCVFTL